MERLRRRSGDPATMTKLLEEAFSLARQLSDEEQDVLAARIITELTDDDDFDRRIAATIDQLDWLIEEATAEFRSGHTEELDPERL
jgi:phosphoglycerate-specific signal transduction histidine kinase